MFKKEQGSVNQPTIYNELVTSYRLAKNLNLTKFENEQWNLNEFRATVLDLIEKLDSIQKSSFDVSSFIKFHNDVIIKHFFL